MYQDLRPFRITTERILIRPVMASDAKDFYEFVSDPLVCKYLTFTPFSNVRSVKKMLRRMEEAFFVGSDLNMSVVSNATNKVIGSISLSFKKEHNHADVGYLFNYEYWHLGYASEALKAIIKYAFMNLEIDKITASYIKDNISSEKLLLKNGFKIIEELNNGFTKQNLKYDLVKCELLKPQY